VTRKNKPKSCEVFMLFFSLGIPGQCHQDGGAKYLTVVRQRLPKVLQKLSYNLEAFPETHLSTGHVIWPQFPLASPPLIILFFNSFPL